MDKKLLKKDALIHSILSYSYFVYFILTLIAFLANIFVGFRFAMHPKLGITLMLWGTLIIFYAQIVSSKTYHHSDANLAHPYFLYGPYKFSRTPTHFGLLFLIAGAGVFFQMPFVIASALVGYVITRYSFVKYQEKKLVEMFGDQYVEYKKRVSL